MQLPQLFKNSIAYLILNIAQKSFGFFLLPLYTAFLTPEDYGILNVVTSITSLCTYFFTLSLQGASVRFNFKYSSEPEKVNEIWIGNFLAILINGLFWFFILVIFHEIIIDNAVDGIAFYPYILIGLISALFSPVYMYYQTYLQAKQQALAYSKNSMLYFLLTLLLTISAVTVLDLHSLGVLLAALVANIVFALFAFTQFAKLGRLKISFSYLRESLGYSLPLLPHHLSGWIDGMLNRLFLNRLADLASVGLYSVSCQFGMVISVIGFGINQAFSPWFFVNEKTTEGRKKIILCSDLTIAGLCLITFGLCLLSPELLRLMTSERYHSIYPSIQILALANLLDTYYYFFVAVLFLGKTKYISYITFISACFGCFLNYFFIMEWGYLGASAACLIVQFVRSLIVLALSLKRCPAIKYNWLKHYGEFCLVAVVLLIMNSIYNINLLSVLLIKGLAFILILSTLLFLNKNKLMESIRLIQNMRRC